MLRGSVRLVGLQVGFLVQTLLLAAFSPCTDMDLFMQWWAGEQSCLCCFALCIQGDFIIKRVAICNVMPSGAVWWGTQPRVGSRCSYGSV